MSAAASPQPFADLPDTELLANLLLVRPRPTVARSTALAVIPRANVGRLMTRKPDERTGGGGEQHEHGDA